MTETIIIPKGEGVFLLKLPNSKPGTTVDIQNPSGREWVISQHGYTKEDLDKHESYQWEPKS